MVWREGSGFRTIRFFGISLRIDERLDGVNEDERTEPQDADYSYVPSLSDELALLILARVPRSVYGTLCSVNKRYLDLLRTGELYKVRREIGIKEPLVFMLASGEPSWRALDPRLGSSRFLPVLPSDACFMFGDKESLCTGTHLLVCGREFEGLVTWRYELTADQWFKGPPMITPRCLFGSASCGDVACVAGGFKVLPVKEILNSAEMYDPETKSWFSLPKMNKARKLCSGCFMDNKFYVIGGEGESGNLICGEFYDLERKRWVLIPDMMKGAFSSSSDSPPLVAVVNNELYALDASSNQVMIYLKNTNSWKELGKVPVRADRSRGWGVAFKSLGDELLVIGGTWDGSVGRGMMTICTCRPDPSSNDFTWRVLKTNGNHLSPFVFNCSVMVA